MNENNAINETTACGAGSRLDRFERGFVGVLDGFAIALMAALVVVVAYSILARQLLYWPAAWTQEIAAALCAWMVSIGAAVAWSRGAHIVIDTFLRRVKGRGKVWAFRAVQCVCLFFFLITVVGACQMMRKAGLTVTGALRISYSYLYLALAIGGIAMILISLFNIVRGHRIDDPDYAPVDGNAPTSGNEGS